MARLVVGLKAAGVHTIGFDVAFTEPERNVAQELIEATVERRDSWIYRLPGATGAGHGP